MYKYLIYSLLFVSFQLHAQNEENSKKWKSFEVKTLSEQLQKQLKETKRRYLTFLKETSMNAGIYLLPKGAADGQQPHDTDEIYYVLEGKAKVRAGSEAWETKKGDVIFVEDKIEHKFFEVEEDLLLYVVFSETNPKENDIDGALFSNKQLSEGRNNKVNVWNQFLDVSTLRFGNYMLPKSLNGDEILTHKVDEINLVIGGKGKFKMGDEI